MLQAPWLLFLRQARRGSKDPLWTKIHHERDDGLCAHDEPKQPNLVEPHRDGQGLGGDLWALTSLAVEREAMVPVTFRIFM